MKRKKLLKIYYIVFIFFLVVFIFSNSSVNIPDSAERSGSILKIINVFLYDIGSNIELSDNFVRKIAHVLEFFTLGASLSLSPVVFDKKKKSNLLFAFICCLTAMTDETIQYFTARGSMLLDTWLDFFSAVLGICFMSALLMLLEKKYKK